MMFSVFVGTWAAASRQTTGPTERLVAHNALSTCQESVTTTTMSCFDTYVESWTCFSCVGLLCLLALGNNRPFNVCLDHRAPRIAYSS